MEIWNRFKNITAVTSTRENGVSVSPYSSLNMAFHVGDNGDVVIKNREKFFNNTHIRVNDKNIVFVAQSHSNVTLKVDKSHVGEGFYAFETGVNADALYTKVKGLNLAIYHADCVPVFIYVPSHEIVGIIHAGKAGSLNNITGLFLEKLFSEEAVKPEEVFAHLGPSLSFGHRHITKEEAEVLASQGGIIQKAVKATYPSYFLDLPLLNILTLRHYGIPLENVTFSDECTYENNDKYFSFAKEGITGRNISLIRLN